MILATALKSLSSSIVVAHNHPSGSLKPSQNDISLTRKIKEACGLVDIQMLVHLILTPANEYYSFADEGCL
jgi:DNA repair protein RadC